MYEEQETITAETGMMNAPGGTLQKFKINAVGVKVSGTQITAGWKDI